MPVPGRGHKSYLQIAKEVTYGTANPTPGAYRRYEIISMSINPEQGIIPDPSLNDQASRRGVYPAGIIYRGSFVIRCNYHGLVEIYRGALGAIGPPASSGGPPPAFAIQTFKETPSLPSYTLEQIEGQPEAASTCSKVVGTYFTGLTIRGTAGTGSDAMLQVEVGVIARDKTPAAPIVGVPTGPAAPLAPVLFHHATTVDVGNADAVGLVRLRNFEMALNSPHTDDRFYFGAINQDQPLRNDFMTCKWRFQMEYITETILTAMRAGTIGSPELVFTGPTGGTPTFQPTLTLRSGLAIYSEETRPVDGYGIIVATAAMEAYNDGTGDNSVLTISTKSQDAIIT